MIISVLAEHVLRATASDAQAGCAIWTLDELDSFEVVMKLSFVPEGSTTFVDARAVVKDDLCFDFCYGYCPNY